MRRSRSPDRPILKSPPYRSRYTKPRCPRSFAAPSKSDSAGSNSATSARAGSSAAQPANARTRSVFRGKCRRMVERPGIDKFLALANSISVSVGMRPCCRNTSATAARISSRAIRGVGVLGVKPASRTAALQRGQYFRQRAGEIPVSVRNCSSPGGVPCLSRAIRAISLKMYWRSDVGGRLRVDIGASFSAKDPPFSPSLSPLQHGRRRRRQSSRQRCLGWARCGPPGRMRTSGAKLSIGIVAPMCPNRPIPISRPSAAWPLAIGSEPRDGGASGAHPPAHASTGKRKGRGRPTSSPPGSSNPMGRRASPATAPLADQKRVSKLAPTRRTESGLKYCR